MLKENTKYKVIKSGLNIQFNYTPLYTNYEASSPREVPVGSIISVGELFKETRVYDGMPVTTQKLNSVITGFKSDPNYGNGTSCILDVLNLNIDESFVKEI